MNIVYQEPMNNNVKEGARNSTQSLIVATPTSCIYVRFTVCTKKHCQQRKQASIMSLIWSSISLVD